MPEPPLAPQAALHRGHWPTTPTQPPDPASRTSSPARREPAAGSRAPAPGATPPLARVARTSPKARYDERWAMAARGARRATDAVPTRRGDQPTLAEGSGPAS